MCGLVTLYGAAGRDQTPQVHAKLEAGLKALTHRGPDGKGCWVSENASVGLGHTRLAIVGVRTGQQPMQCANGLIHAVVNGEFYDWEPLRDELESLGHQFRSQSDSEVLLHLYEERGVDCLEQLRGEFAFVLWDERKQRLFAGRDRFGVKPLVYGRDAQGRLCLASEAKALFAMGMPAAWNQQAFREVASHQYLSPSQSLFKGISMLRPGSYLLAENHRWRTASYWSLNYPKPADSPRSPATADAVHASDIRALLEESVRIRLQGEHPVACYLSGGIDSSATAALAVRHSEYPVHCFGIAFEDAQYDEHKDAEAFAESIGARFEPVPVDSDAIVHSLADAVRFSEGLCINGQLSAKFILSKAASDAGFKSVLVGEGADELFCGYSHLVRDYWVARAANGDSRARSRLRDMEEKSGPQSGVMFPAAGSDDVSTFPQLRHMPTALAAKLQTGLRLRPFLRTEFQHGAQTSNIVQELLDDEGIGPEIANRCSVDQAAILWMRTALAGYILKTLGDGTEMAHSIEGRVPFLDHKLFERARRVPVDCKLRGGVAKSILRRSLAGVLPEKLCQRPKHPLLAPPISGRSGSRGWEMALDVVHSQSFSSQPFWNAPRLGNWMRRLEGVSETTRRQADPIVMMALSTHALQQAFSLGGGEDA